MVCRTINESVGNLHANRTRKLPLRARLGKKKGSTHTHRHCLSWSCLRIRLESVRTVASDEILWRRGSEGSTPFRGSHQTKVGGEDRWIDRCYLNPKFHGWYLKLQKLFSKEQCKWMIHRSQISLFGQLIEKSSQRLINSFFVLVLYQHVSWILFPWFRF